MNAALKKLYDQKGKAVEGMKSFEEKLSSGKMSPEDDKQFDAWNEELKAANANIERLRVIDDNEKESAIAKLKGEKGNGEARTETPKFNYAEGKRAWEKATSGAKLTEKEKRIFDVVSEQDEAFRRFVNLGMNALDESERMRVNELKNSTFDGDGQRVQTVTTTAGGYTIPQGFWDDIVVAKKLVSPFFEEGKVGTSGISKSVFYYINTATGNDLPMPTIDDTAVVGELLAINGDAFGNTADMTFGQVIMKAYKYSPKPMKVPNELLQDTGIDLPGLIAEVLGTRNGRIQNTHLTTGDNTNKPQGIVAGASAGHVSVGNDALVFADILDLEHSVDPAYRKSPSARFMMNDGILKAIKKIAIGSADARSLWMPSFRDGAPDTIDGYQYLINQDMQATVADGTKIMLFGDMKQYAIRQAGPPVLRFLGERFADAGQVAWVLFERLDGRYRNTAGIKYLEVS